MRGDEPLPKHHGAEPGQSDPVIVLAWALIFLGVILAIIAGALAWWLL